MIKVFIPDENVIGEVVTEMAHGALVHYERGGFHYEVLLDEDDYEVLEEIFHYEEIE